MMGIAIVLVLLILGVGGYMVLGNKSQSNNANETMEKEQGGDSDEVTSIQDALAKSMTLKCDFTTEQGVKIVAQIKNGMVRSDVSGSTPEQTGSAIIKDKKIYFWNAQGGFITEIPDVSATPAEGQDKVTSGQSTLQAIEQYKKYCKRASVDDSVFVLPTNVKFQDMSSMMQQKMPSGTMPSGAMDKSQYEELMKRYAPSGN